MLLNKDVLHIPESHQHWFQCSPVAQSALSLPTTSFAVPFLCVTHSHRSMGMGQFISPTNAESSWIVCKTPWLEIIWTHSHIVKIFVDHLTLLRQSSSYVSCFRPLRLLTTLILRYTWFAWFVSIFCSRNHTGGYFQWIAKQTKTCWTRGLGPGHNSSPNDKTGSCWKIHHLYMIFPSHMLHVWNIYQHLPHKWAKCR